MIRLGTPLFRKLTQSMARFGCARLQCSADESPLLNRTRRDLHSFDRQSSTSLRFRHSELYSCGDAMGWLDSQFATRINGRKEKKNLVWIKDLQISLHFELSVVDPVQGYE
jgi:hypothetical protein